VPYPNCTNLRGMAGEERDLFGRTPIHAACLAGDADRTALAATASIMTPQHGLDGTVCPPPLPSSTAQWWLDVDMVRGGGV
jgi:hypothetical protein